MNAPPGARPRLLWTVAFAAAFGWVEAAVVVYLRRLVYPDGFVFPLRPLDAELLRVEAAREFATIVMLVAVAALAGRRRWERFGFFLAGFGTWDLAYYLGLKVAIGWPAGWADPDILFLLPVPWVGPVYAPFSIAALMVVSGAAVVKRAADGRRLRAGPSCWLLATAGCAVLLWSFMRDQDAGLRGAMPSTYPVWALALGDALLAAAAWRFLRGNQTVARS